MSPADSIIGLYERNAHAWDRERRRNLIERRWLDLFLNEVGWGASVVDIGCGAGEPVADYLIMNGCRLTGVDSAPTMLAICRSRFPAHQWVETDMRDMNLGRTFEGLVVWHSFFHLVPEEQRHMFDVFALHAAPRATLLFTTGPAHGEHVTDWQGEPLYHASLSTDEYRELLFERGFEVLAHMIEDPGCGGATVWLARKQI
jgi:trans-aconitate methyltransferase